MRRTKGLVLCVQLALLVGGLFVGGLSIWVAGLRQTTSFAATSPLALTLELTTGGLLITAGVLSQHRTSTRAAGYLFAAAGFAWFIIEWNSPAVGSSLVFTGGLVFSCVTPVLIAHAALRYPDRRLTATERLILGVCYASTLVLSGLLPALFFDPGRQSCRACPPNLLALHSSPVLVEWGMRAGVVAGAVWTIALAVFVGDRLARSGPARRRVSAPVALAAIGYLLVVSADYWHSMRRGSLSSDDAGRRYWTVAALSLIVMALGTAWAPIRRRITRTTVARLVVDVTDAPPAGGLREAMAAALGDPLLVLMYPLAQGRLVDGRGRPAEARAGQSVTPLVRRGETLALLGHRPGLFDAADLVEEITSTARLALDKERLQAEVQEQLADLQASRARIVDASDRERRRLERDLHDGAQQRLVSLALAIRLAALRLDHTSDRCVADNLELALIRVTDSIAQLRVLAHGLYPRELGDEGLSAGLEILAETAPLPVSVAAIDDDRYPAAIESVAYFAVAKSILRGGGSSASITVHRFGDRLHIEVAVDAQPDDLIDVQDRVGAVGGRLGIYRTDRDRIRIAVDLPCAL